MSNAASPFESSWQDQLETALWLIRSHPTKRPVLQTWLHDALQCAQRVGEYEEAIEALGDFLDQYAHESLGSKARRTVFDVVAVLQVVIEVVSTDRLAQLLADLLAYRAVVSLHMSMESDCPPQADLAEALSYYRKTRGSSRHALMIEEWWHAVARLADARRISSSERLDDVQNAAKLAREVLDAVRVVRAAVTGIVASARNAFLTYVVRLVEQLESKAAELAKHSRRNIELWDLTPYGFPAYRPLFENSMSEDLASILNKPGRAEIWESMSGEWSETTKSTFETLYGRDVTIGVAYFNDQWETGLSEEYPPHPLHTSGVFAATADTILRQYPTPLAYAFFDFHRHTHPFHQCMCGVPLLVPLCARYLLAIAVSELIHSHGAIPGDKANVATLLPESVHKLFTNPRHADGHWIDALRDTTRLLMGRSGTKIPELASRFSYEGEGTGIRVLERLGQLRNEVFHPETLDCKLTPQEATDVVRNQLSGLIAMLYSEMDFVQRFPLCFLQRNELNRVFLHRFMGINPRDLELPAIPTTSTQEMHPFLFMRHDGDGHDGHVLNLNPFWKVVCDDDRSLAAIWGIATMNGDNVWQYSESQSRNGDPKSEPKTRDVKMNFLNELESERMAIVKWPAGMNAEIQRFLNDGNVCDFSGMTTSRFRIGPVAAVGGSAKVFIARPESSGSGPVTEIAVKVFVDQSNLPQQRFQREIELLNACRDLTGVIDCVGEGGIFHDRRNWPYLAMPYVRGGTLLDFINNKELSNGSYSARAIHYFREIANILLRIHGRDIVHRDLKPENILLVDDKRVVICDFGHAKRIRKLYLIDPPNLERADPFPYGTTVYCPPERFFPGRDWHYVRMAQFDIYSLGILLLHLESRCLPKVWLPPKALIGENAPKMWRRTPLINTPAIGGLALRRPKLARVVEKCVQRDPDKRYPSVADLIADL